MLIPIAVAISILGTLSSTVRSWVGAPIYWASVLVLLITLYGMTV
ncbi:hypothetical protein [Ramlibacter cellulosilyticus]|nr:hypothetical protein [Ramlibacter cellulosilyticus]